MTKTGKLFVGVTTALLFACSSGSVGSGGGTGGTGVFPGNGGSGQVGTVGVLGGDPGGTWVVTGDGGSSKTGPGKNGTGGSSGTGGSTSVTCAPGVVGAIVTGCGYPYASNVALTSVVFNESEVHPSMRREGLSRSSTAMNTP